MINKYKDLEVDIKLLDGLGILAVLLFSLTLNVYSFDFGVMGLILFNLFQLIFAFVLAIELEEIYFNHKKVHLWVLILVVFGLLFALSFFVGAFGIIGSFVLAFMIYLLSFKFKKMFSRPIIQSLIKNKGVCDTKKDSIKK